MVSIDIREPGASASIPASDVYFAFASGRLSYDCVSCNAQCCRGHGYFITRTRELGSHARRPGLPLFIGVSDAGNSSQYYVSNCAPGCFFLSNDGRCQIHAEHGYSAKPETCRLFPFNNLSLLGRFLIVAPHDYLCPLEVVPAGRTNIQSAHATLTAVMSAEGIHATVPRLSLPVGDLQATIVREQRIVEASERYGGTAEYLPFVEEQIHLSELDDPSAATSPRLVDVVPLLRELLGLPAAPEAAHPEMVHTLVGTTPFLRSRYLFSRPNGVPQSSQLEPTRVALAMLCISLIAEAAMLAGMERISFQTLLTIDRSFRPLIWLLAHVNDVMVWRESVPIVPVTFDLPTLRPRFWQLARGLLPEVQAKKQLTLGTLLLAFTPNDPIERAIFLRQTARRLAEDIVPIASSRKSARQAAIRTRVQSKLQRWALARADDSSLKAALGRRGHAD